MPLTDDLDPNLYIESRDRNGIIPSQTLQKKSLSAERLQKVRQSKGLKPQLHINGLHHTTVASRPVQLIVGLNL